MSTATCRRATPDVEPSGSAALVECDRGATTEEHHGLAIRVGISARDIDRVREELLELSTSWRTVLADDPMHARPIVSSLLKGRVTFEPIGRSKWRAHGEGHLIGLFSREVTGRPGVPKGTCPALVAQIRDRVGGGVTVQARPERSSTSCGEGGERRPHGPSTEGRVPDALGRHRRRAGNCRKYAERRQFSEHPRPERARKGDVRQARRADGGRTPVRLHAAGQSEEIGTPCGVA